MNTSKLQKILKRILYPIRLLMWRFVNNINQPEDLFYKAGIFIATDKIEGDYLEFGVFSGSSFVSAYHLIENAYRYSNMPSIWNTQQDCIEMQKLWEKMRFIAFDSFQGLPKPKGIDALSSDFAEGKFSNSEGSFMSNISTKGVPSERVVIVPGWFHETLNENTRKKYDIKHAAIVHIDSDLYESAKLVLNFIKPLLVDGTIIIFDDWYNFKGNPNLGEQRAFKEWLDENREWVATQYQKEGVWSNSFIMSNNISND